MEDNTNTTSAAGDEGQVSDSTTQDAETTDQGTDQGSDDSGSTGQSTGDDSGTGDGAPEGGDTTNSADYSAYAFGDQGDAGDAGDQSTDSYDHQSWGGLKRAGMAVADLTMAGYDGARKLGVAFQEAWHGFTDDQMAEDADRIHRYNLNAAEQSRLHNAKIDLGLTDPNDTWREEDPEEAFGV